MPKERRHAAIMFTDIVGYTALMGSDEDKAFEILSKNRKIHQQLLEKYNGTLIKEMGDGMLISFNLASDAVYCAIEIQKKCKEWGIPLKIGIHEGEMVFEDSDILGDAVNIASRLESGTQTGCISISGKVYSDIKNRKDFHAKFIKEKRFKNVEEPIRVYQIFCGEEDEISENHGLTKYQIKNSKKLIKVFGSLGLILLILVILVLWSNKGILLNSTQSDIIISHPDKSIAVLPFRLLNDDTEKEFLSDAFTDAIVMNLVKISAFDKVIPLISVMKYKGSSKSANEIGNELEVAYILQGTYLQEKDKVRVTVSLIDTKKNNIIWSHPYDRDYNGIFSIQSEIPLQIVENISIHINDSERSRINEVPTTNIKAYELYQKASMVYKAIDQSELTIDSLKQCLTTAIELDSNYAHAYGLLGLLNVLDGSIWGSKSMSIAAWNAKPYAEKALSIDPNEYWALLATALIYGWAEWNYVETEKYFLRAINALPNDNSYRSWYGFFLYNAGRNQEAIAFLKELEKKGFHFKQSNNFQTSYIRSLLKLKRYKEASKFNKKFLIEYEEDYYHDAAEYYLIIQKYDSALYYLDRISIEERSLTMPKFLCESAIAHYKIGEQEKYDELLNIMIEKSNEQKGPYSFWIACLYSSIKDKDNAFFWLDIAFEERSVEMFQLKSIEHFDFLRDDPRYWHLYEKTGHAAYDRYLESRR